MKKHRQVVSHLREHLNPYSRRDIWKRIGLNLGEMIRLNIRNQLLGLLFFQLQGRLRGQIGDYRGMDYEEA